MDQSDIFPSPQKKFELPNFLFYAFSFAAFCFVILYFKDIRDNLLLFREVHIGWVVLALAAQAGTYVFNTLVYYDLLGIYGLSSSFSIRTLIQANIVSLFFNQSVPSVGLSGNAFYFSFLSKRGVSYEQAYSLVLLELICFYLALIGSFVLFLVFLTVTDPKPFFMMVFGWGILLFTFLTIGISHLGHDGVVRKFLTFINRFSLAQRMIAKFKQTRVTVTELHHIEPPWKVFWRHSRASFLAVLFQFSILLLDSLTLFALFRGLHVELSYFMVFMGFMLTKAITSFPTSPGALIVYESSMVFIYVTLGVPLSVAITATLLYRMLSFWLPMPMGLFFYRLLSKEKEVVL
jgi:uncharacterized protein (TIRG00374 family)